MRFRWIILYSSCLTASCSTIPASESLNSADTVILQAELGRRLFSDNILSRDYSISCASCHRPELAFADTLPVSSGMSGRKGFRNTPSLLSVGELPYLFADGGVPDLRRQVIAPVEDHREMDIALAQVEYRLQHDNAYRILFQRAFNRAPDSWGIVRALEQFQLTLKSGTSLFDQFLANGDSLIFSAAEWKGYQLFFGKAGCSGCHSGKWLSDFAFYNAGLADGDPGRARITENADDFGKFRTPVLRNLTVTYPYMHNGSMRTLPAVVDHFDGLFQLALDKSEKENIVQFLETLTDSVYLKVK